MASNAMSRFTPTDTRKLKSVLVLELLISRSRCCARSANIIGVNVTDDIAMSKLLVTDDVVGGRGAAFARSTSRAAGAGTRGCRTASASPASCSC